VFGFVCVGIFGPKMTSTPITTQPLPTRKRAVALADFTAVKDVELTFKKGDLVTFWNVDPESGWAQGEMDGKVGWFPMSYIQFLEGAALVAKLQEKASFQLPSAAADNS
jgi:hypothetical protein